MIQISKNDNMRPNSKKMYFLVYTVLFILLSFFCFGIYLLLYDKSCLRFMDTYNQHYICFVKMGQWFRDLIFHGKLVIWDRAMGYGSDYFLTLSGSNSGSLFDPVNWMSIFVPTAWGEYGFALTVLLRMYLTGIAFSILAFRRCEDNCSVLCGTLAYTFCACTYVGLYQNTFFLPMYVFPILIYGTDELFENDRPLIYTLTLALSALWSYYFTYMMAVLVIFYCLIKWLFLERKSRSVKKFLILFGKFLLYSVLAAGMAAVVLIPVARAIVDMGRLELKTYIPILYDGQFYKNLFKGLIGTYDMLARDCKIGFCLIAFLSVAGLFVTELKYNAQLKIEIILMAIGLCIPFFGHVMNGFSYIANRWIWAFALAVGLSVTAMIPRFREFGPLHFIILISGCIVYLLALYRYCGVQGSRQFAVLSICLILLCTSGFFAQTLSEGLYKKLTVILTCATVILQAYFYYSAEYSNEFNSNIEVGTAFAQATEKGGLPLLKDIDMSDGTRYISNGQDFNAGWLYNASSTNFYYSFYNENIDQFNKSMALNVGPSPHQYTGLDKRSELMALLGVNYYFTSGGLLPADYNILEAEGIGYNNTPVQVWKPAKNYSIFTRFGTALPRTEFDQYPPYDRQQLLMQKCVLENVAGKSKFAQTDERVSYVVENVSDNIKITGGQIIVAEAGAQMDLVFDEISNAELYLYFDNIDFRNGLENSYSIYVAGMLRDENIKGLYDYYWAYNNISHMYGGKHDWLLNLGDSSEPVDRIRITFNNAGTYTLEDIAVYADDIEGILHNIRELNHDVYNISFPDNRINVSLECAKKEYLFIAVPYSEGWKAYDNGKEIEVLKADVGFMALELPPGWHDIRLVYKTPGFAAGLLIGVFSAGLFAAVTTIHKKKIRERSHLYFC